MKAKVYLETTIPSYLVSRPSRDLVVAAHQQITRQWWETRRASFNSFISELVLQEAGAGDPALAARRLQVLEEIPLLAVDNSIARLGESLVAGGAIPRKAAADAVHIAVAAAYGCDYLLT